MVIHVQSGDVEEVEDVVLPCSYNHEYGREAMVNLTSLALVLQDRRVLTQSLTLGSHPGYVIITKTVTIQKKNPQKMMIIGKLLQSTALSFYRIVE